MAAVTICSDFGAPQNKVCHCFHCLFAMKWWDQMPWSSFFESWVYARFSFFSFTFIKKLFSFSSLSATRVVSSAYLKLLIFLLAILIPACVSTSLAFHMMHSAYKLNKQGDDIHPWCIPFPVWNQSIVPCPVLTVASWPAYRFLRKHVRCLVFPSLEEFSTVCCDSHSQRLWHSQ